MTLCKHKLVTDTCTIELYGLDYDPWGNFRTDRSQDVEWDVPSPVYYPSDNPCPSQLDWDRLETLEAARLEGCMACNYLEEGGTVYDDHTCNSLDYVERPLPTEYPKPEVVGRPEWATQYDCAGTSFLGFYRNDLQAAAGFGIDPWFASVH